MCGIAGIISAKANKEKLQQMLNLQKHRGPDHTGNYVDSCYCALGHNRLSIIDLSAKANQPFKDNSGRYHLTFNGEIYNYKELKQELKAYYNFKTASDTEVLLAAFIVWGKSCLNKLNGMFAFAIWDNKLKKLFAARDRFGVKPFFYSEENKDFYFSSEIKAIRSVLKSNQPNEQVWANYFTFGSYGMPSDTFYDEIFQLPGGHFLEYQAGNLKVTRWYDFEKNLSKYSKILSFEEAKQSYYKILIDSISLRFRADVPIGFNISGGVDSSLLLALVNRLNKNKHIKAYTFYAGDENYDELPWVQKMIETTRNPLTKVKIQPSDVIKKAQFLSNIQDEPYAGLPTLAYAALFENAKKDGIKVLLDGQGMDEQWAGYDYYQNPGTTATIQGTGKMSPFRVKVLNDDFKELAKKPGYPTPFDNDLQNLQYRDLFYTKIPRALRFNDRISMAYSTELREPFLDYRMVEFAFSQPKTYKIHNGIQKYLIREILKEIAPQDLSYAPKRPLQTPQREWVGNELKDFTEENIEKLRYSKISYWFNFEEMQREWNNYKAGDNQSSFHIWQWINAGLLMGN
ncbi:asparagine synthetase [Salegentibacter salinarum]|uniref:asparagine synthase (glutamine-hydrolyzing) n=1 Tax=Salegentibacter salinarum TaxID=447422 RepID=A0A2N0U2J6_9FLAO|nr:asparagine synthase (glutamine-hydrolyzing) [Salegentibacter salinarum]PKD21118.1 asparagine synthetase [Salegentibacter salinarum]SKB76135.1 asparagine synthase (glutamine-hydrolysing) [Salegentibacter salinarum]